MKRANPVAVALVILVVGLCAGGCSKDRHLSPAEFIEKARTAEEAGDVHEVHFVGVREGRAYLREWRHWPVIGERTRLLWTEASGLPPATLRELEARKDR